MKHSPGKILSVVLAIAMVLGMLPVRGFAVESTDTYIADCPSFTLRGPEGVYQLENYGENGIVLFFGRSGCGNTRALMGELDGRIGTLENQGVQVFANLENTYVPEDYADMAALYPNIPFTYSDGVLRKILFKLVEPNSQGFYFPLVFVINPEGQIIHYSTGYVSDLQTLLSKVEAVSTGNPLPEPEVADENYYGSAYRYTGDNEALAGIIRQQLAAKIPDIVIHDGTWDGEGDSWTGETLAYAMFEILEACQEEYGPYMIPDTWTYYLEAQQVVISLIYAREPEVPTQPGEPEPAPDVTGGTCGENLTWTLDGEGTLTISGTGNMENYETEEDTPWAEQREEIKRIVLEAGVTQIGAYAFAGCTNLTGVTISSSVRRIGSNAFLSCGLTELTIPEGVTQIDDAAFENCGRLTDIILSASVTQIGPNAFYGCHSLTTVHYGGTEEEKADISIISENKPILEAQWHYRCDGVTCESTEPEDTKPEVTEPKETEPEQTEPEGTIPAPDDADGTCGENLTWTLDEEGTLTVSGTGSMANYDTEEDTPWAEQREEIKRVVLEEGVTEIGAYAFASCTNLTGVTISNSVRRIGSNAFLSCGLTEVTIPEGVTQIDDAAFENCGRLTDIILSASVTKIGPNAFYGCSSLTTVHYSGTEEEKADISIISENKPVLEAQWHYRCDGVTCESTEPEETKPEVTEPKETEPEVTEPAETKPATPPVEEDKPMENPFVDVAEDAYYAAPVLWAAEKGITTGMSETSFAPDATCTRGQIVTFLWRSKGSPAPASAHNPFTDVPADAWYTDAVLWAVEQGITTGTSATTFSPDAGCTRGQVATFLWRAEGEPASGAENIFTDITPDAYYYDAVLWAVAKEITNGMGDGAFAPDATCTRGQIVTFLYRAMA